MTKAKKIKEEIEFEAQLDAELGPLAELGHLLKGAHEHIMTQRTIFKLKAEERPGYYRHWFSDHPGRLLEAEEKGWEYVTDSDGNRVTYPVDEKLDKSGDILGYLMEIHTIFAKEDLECKNKLIEQAFSMDIDYIKPKTLNIIASYKFRKIKDPNERWKAMKAFDKFSKDDVHFTPSEYIDLYFDDIDASIIAEKSAYYNKYGKHEIEVDIRHLYYNPYHNFPEQEEGEDDGVDPSYNPMNIIAKPGWPYIKFVETYFPSVYSDQNFEKVSQSKQEK